MSIEVPSEPCLQHQIRTGVQYYIPGGHPDRRGRGVLCTGRGGGGYAICFCEHLDLGIEKHKLFAMTVKYFILPSTNREGEGILLEHITTLMIRVHRCVRYDDNRDS